MAKTRSQSRAAKQSFGIKINKTSSQIKKTNRQAKNQVDLPRIVECFVRLNRLDKNMIATLTASNQCINTRVLRERNATQLSSRVTAGQPTIKPKKSVNQIVAISKAAIHTSKAMRLWEQTRKLSPKDTLNIDQIVLSRMSGHRPWPARVTRHQKNGIALFFFGTNESGTVKRAEVVPFDLCKEIIDEYLKVSISELSRKSLSYHM